MSRRERDCAIGTITSDRRFPALKSSSCFQTVSLFMLARLGVKATGLKPSAPWQCSQRRASSMPRKLSPLEASAMVSVVHATLEGIARSSPALTADEKKQTTKIAAEASVRANAPTLPSARAGIKRAVLLCGTGSSFICAKRGKLIARNDFYFGAHRVVSGAAEFPAGGLVNAGVGELELRLADVAGQNLHVVVGAFNKQ